MGTHRTRTEPEKPCSSCGEITFYRHRGWWWCFRCYELPHCGIPERWRTLPLPLATPKARDLARKEGVDLEDVPGSGPGGMVNVFDVRAWVRMRWGGRP